MGYVNNVTDVLFADVSEFNPVATSAYTNAGYRVLSFRSNDGTYRDGNFAANWAFATQACDAGLLNFFCVYYYWRPWKTGISTHMDMVNSVGGPHPKMVSMIDLESGGNPVQDWSGTLQSEYDALGEWLGDPRRVIGYANTGDLISMWPTRPPCLLLIGAGYGQDPMLPGQIAHQYTDGTGFGVAAGLPDGAPPFGNNDMNCADGLSVEQFAAELGVGIAPPPPGVSLPSDASIQTLTPLIVSQFGSAA